MIIFSSAWGCKSDHTTVPSGFRTTPCYVYQRNQSTSSLCFQRTMTCLPCSRTKNLAPCYIRRTPPVRIWKVRFITRKHSSRMRSALLLWPPDVLTKWTLMWTSMNWSPVMSTIYISWADWGWAKRLPYLMSRGQGKERRDGQGPCTVRSNVSLVMAAWGPTMKRQTRVKTLSSHNFVGKWYLANNAKYGFRFK